MQTDLLLAPALGMVVIARANHTSTTPAPTGLPNAGQNYEERVLTTAGVTAGYLPTVQADGTIVYAAPAVPTALGSFTATAGTFSGGIAAWGAALPGAQPSTTGTVTGFTAGSSTATKVDSTYTGNTGSTAYTVGDIVLALKQQGLLAS